jgi:4-carboxymuconolactone decarboxylase
MMTASNAASFTLSAFDDATRALVLVAAALASGSEAEVRQAVTAHATLVPPRWMEELVLQTYLFAGFPRALNGMREWRRVHPRPLDIDEPRTPDEWRVDGEATCAAVYGAMYERLRHNVQALHPRLDAWMVSEGYGKVLSRPGLDLPRRELCIIAACAASNQDRQLHSHLHGALNVGVAPKVITATLTALAGVLGEERARSVELLWARVRGK